MSPATTHSRPDGPRERTRSCAIGLACHRCEQRFPLDQPGVFACSNCGKGLDVEYDYELAARRFEEVPRDRRPQNIWRFEELLPVLDASVQTRSGRYAGYTPLIHAERLGAELGLGNLYLKDDSTSRPTLSHNHRVVPMSIAPLLQLGPDQIG